jgi:capsular polysaccharide export protein
MLTETDLHGWSMQQIETGGWARFAGMRVLLLQGSHGYFFQRVAQALLSAGVGCVLKIDFNGGDSLFSAADAHVYRGRMQDWPSFLTDFMHKHEIDCVMVFGDCRPIHVAARGVAHAHGAQFWAFEEGYVRPNFITLEPHGVNGNSRLPTDRASYDQWQLLDLPPQVQVHSSFWPATGVSIAYFAATILMRWRFLHYQHHRPVRLVDGLRKWYYGWKERAALVDLKGHGGASPYFLSVLQVALDAQVRMHSKYESIAQYIDETVRSFAQYAPQEAVLLIKHHPMDRGYTDYTRQMKQLAKELGLGQRLRYIHDQHLPKLMSHAQGLVTINSTVGLSAMDHSLAVKTLGQAIYDIPGLTSHRSLSDFWQHSALDKPEPELHAKFVNYVIAHTQINGNFYRELPGAGVAGLHYRDVPAIHPSPLFEQLPVGRDYKQAGQPKIVASSSSAAAS